MMNGTRCITILIVVLFISCAKDDIEPTINYSLLPSEVNLHYDEKMQLSVVANDEIVPSEKIIWESTDTRRGKIDESGLLTAAKVGDFGIIAFKDEVVLKADVSIIPYYDFFREPTIDFGITREEVMEYEERKILEETSTGLIFEESSTEVLMVGYLFDDDDRLKSSYAIFSTENNNISKVTSFYTERYTILGMDDDVVFMEHLDYPVTIGMGVDLSLGFYVIYMDGD